MIQPLTILMTSVVEWLAHGFQGVTNSEALHSIPSQVTAKNELLYIVRGMGFCSNTVVTNFY